jgi:monomeric isocitrate dehydrogenase
VSQAKRQMLEEMDRRCSECGDDLPCRRDDCPLRVRLAEIIEQMEQYTRNIRANLHRIDGIIDTVGRYYKAIKH